MFEFIAGFSCCGMIVLLIVVAALARPGNSNVSTEAERKPEADK